MSWKSYKLGNILERKRNKVNLSPEEKYKLVTIKLHHKGVVLRHEKKGADIKSNMHLVNEGDFILSGIDARNGAFGIVPKELDNAIVTNDFWCLEPKKDTLRKDFFLFITSTSFFDYICNQCSDGTTQRIRLQREKFYNYELSLPPIEQQEELVKSLSSNKKLNNDISTEITHQLDLVKQLRQSFLREAMQGKLIVNDELLMVNEETGADLLTKIKAEKEQLIKEKKIKNQKPLPPITEDEIPFKIPENWVWCRLNEVCLAIIDCPHSTPKYIDTETEYYGIDTNCINEKGEITRLRGLSKESYLERIKRLTPKKNDIVYSREGSIGLATFIPKNKNICLGQRVMLLRPPTLVIPEFLKNIVTEEKYKGRLLEKHRGIGAKHVNVRDIVASSIPLPPLSEQKRIVAKLDELMAYCDSLEESIKNSQID